MIFHILSQCFISVLLAFRYFSVGTKCLLKRTRCISRRESGDSSRIAILPARDSETFCIRRYCWEPVRKNSPFFSDASHSILIYENRSVAYWTSSRMTGGWLFFINNPGSFLDPASNSGSSKVLYLISGYSIFSSVDFPTWRDPVMSTALNDWLVFFI